MALPHGSSLFGDIPAGLPSLAKSQKLQRRAARMGFDWPSVEPILNKVDEELAELRAEIESAPAPGQDQRQFEEFGDLLFVMVNLGLQAWDRRRGRPSGREHEIHPPHGLDGRSGQRERPRAGDHDFGRDECPMGSGKRWEKAKSADKSVAANVIRERRSLIRDRNTLMRHRTNRFMLFRMDV